MWQQGFPGQTRAEAGQFGSVLERQLPKAQKEKLLERHPLHRSVPDHHSHGDPRTHANLKPLERATGKSKKQGSVIETVGQT